MDVMDVLEKNFLNTELFFSLSMDGPNINKSLWEKVNQRIPALHKTEQHWEAGKEYSMDFLPKQKDEFKHYTWKNERYGQISQKFKSEKHILVQIAFLVDVHAPFNKFLAESQGDDPQIHVIFTELKKNLVAIMKHFINYDEINGQSASAMLNLDVKNKDIHLPLEKIETGVKTDSLLKLLSPYDQKKEKEKTLQFYIATVKQLQRRLPLEDAPLFNAVCLHPGARTQANSLKMIEQLAKLFAFDICLPCLSKPSNRFVICIIIRFFCHVSLLEILFLSYFHLYSIT